MIKCPSCGRDNAENIKICQFCGELLVQHYSATRKYEDTDYEEGTPKWGSARFGTQSNLIIGVEEEPRTLVFNFEEIEELVIGRRNPDTNEDAPEIDLGDYKAQDKGVSRSHAAIVRKDGSLHIEDRGSANGTFLNGQRLVANQPRVLRDGDDIRLGHLIIRITFEKA